MALIVLNLLTPLVGIALGPLHCFDGQTNRNYPSFSYSKEVISTEEKCRKVLAKSRSVLYTLHLDLPRGRERSLRSDSQHMKLSYDWKIPHVAKIHIDNDFYADILYSLINYACKGNDDNLKVLKWFIKFEALEKSVFERLPCSIMNYFFKCMHLELDDCEFVMECLEKLKVINWLLSSDSSKPGIFTNLFYQIHQTRRDPKNIFWNHEFIDLCISLSSFQLVGDVLKLKNVPCSCDNLFYFYVGEISYAREAIHVSDRVNSKPITYGQPDPLGYCASSPRFQNKAPPLLLLTDSPPRP
ncbi:hypothetical protein AVEN_45374-1 [Araneus ventricosus]|uniref:Uncharacterized protein n=1 Tax=Araneus ventricosus TaxID=182803 RepID=A0A4Y2W0R6_ARAVE|nr:hypothetical protein AVEN_45374-1 [Araneus ventricosus]